MGTTLKLSCGCGKNHEVRVSDGVEMRIKAPYGVHLECEIRFTQDGEEVVVVTAHCDGHKDKDIVEETLKNLCTVCHRNLVDSENWVDTCETCLRENGPGDPNLDRWGNPKGFLENMNPWNG